MEFDDMLGSGSKEVSRGVFRLRPRRAARKYRALAVLLALSLAGLAQVTHTVARGDNLTRLAKRYGTTIKAIVAANKITNPNLIKVGRKLQIPGGVVPSGGGAKRVAVAGGGVGNQHRVAAGENLTRIARRYGTTVQSLIEMNKIRNASLIRVGTILNVPAPGSTIAAPRPVAVSAPPADPAVPVPPQPVAIPDRPPVTTVTSPQPMGVEQLLEHYSRLYGVDPALMKGLAWQESGWKQHVVSSAGAIGVMQVMPQTGEFISRELLKEPVDLKVLDQNVKAGIRFFAFYLSKTSGDEYTAVAGYFQGLRSVWQNGVSERTKRYVDAVLALRGRYAAKAP